MNYYKLGIK